MTGGSCRCGCGEVDGLTRGKWRWSHWLKQESARAAISAGHADVRGENNPMFGKRGPAAPNWNEDRAEVLRRAKLRGISKSLLHRALPVSRQKKGDRRTEEVLGYSRRELKERIESQFSCDMSWENYGDGPGKWHVDHIRPIASFPPGTPVSVVSALSNLRPLWSHENHRKWKRWDG